MSSSSEMKKLIAKVQDKKDSNGKRMFDVEIDGRGHYAVTNLHTGQRIGLPSSPGRGRSMWNSIAELRKIGFHLNNRPQKPKRKNRVSEGARRRTSS